MQRSPQTSKDRTVVFSCGEAAYTVRDLIDAAFFRGELDVPWAEMLRSIAAEEQAAELDLEMDETTVDEAAQTFRYKHDLITAEETERWLEERGLTLEEFNDFFVRCYWDSVTKGRAVPENVEYLNAPADMRELLTAELVLSGKLDGMATRLAQRVATTREANDENVMSGSMPEENRRFLSRADVDPSQVPDLLGQLERDNCWLEEMLRMEALFRGRARNLPTPDSRAREFRSLRLLLTQFAVEIVELESQEAAREALLCVRNDGLSMADVATEGRYPYRSMTLLLDDVPEDLQQRFISVLPGSVLDPVPRGDGFQLWRVLEKQNPNPEDPAVRERIDQGIVDRHFSELCAKHIRWRFVK